MKKRKMPVGKGFEKTHNYVNLPPNLPTSCGKEDEKIYRRKS